jgi:hypothetical protein
MTKFLFLFLFAANVFSQVPSWLVPPSLKKDTANAVKPVYRTKVVRDTVLRIDTVLRVDTVQTVDTVYHWNMSYKYVIRYALTSLKVDIDNPEWLDYSSVSEIVARDTATLRIGSEEIRTLGNIIDQFGNRIPQQDIITAGFTIQVMGDKVVIEYRGKNSVAMFSGNFDFSGFLVATGEIAETNFFASFFPLNLFFGTAKKRIIIEITREVYL